MSERHTAIIIAADKDVALDRFAGKKVAERARRRSAYHRPEQLIEQVQSAACTRAATASRPAAGVLRVAARSGVPRTRR